ncbi:hypothetical protein NVV95_15540 [Herbiconiux sp. CPCC 205716]|uniref:Uncharacterized protein n=1 Tax=Herbiconiux gentiana TaxID=2970912 RepID=A0ABT2GIA7_9MICO|nr:hypothetical protein [Herbiconiux gentiana]MCS5715959.1 hypothetical protein [Herbiconiux gentiana]
MTFPVRLALAIVVLVLGLATLTATLILGLENAPSWLHLVNWVGGGIFGLGIALLVNAIRSRSVPAVG